MVSFADTTAVGRLNDHRLSLASRADPCQDAIIGMTLDGRITSWNPGAEAVFGYAPSEVLGESLDRLVPNRCQGDTLRILDAVRAGQDVGPCQSDGLGKSGARRQLRISVSPIRDAAGEVIAACVVAHDITETKRSDAELFATQERLRAIMEALPVGVAFSSDADCQAVEGNPALLTLFGAQPADNLSASAPNGEAVGRRIRYFSGDRELCDAELPLQRAVTEQTEIPAQELDVELPDGRRWQAEVSGAPIRDQRGEVIGGLAVISDITERKRAQKALLDADRRKDEFLAMLAHELRNPLAPIRNATEVLCMQEDLPERARWAADLIARQSEQLERLVNDLLDVSRITHGRIQLRKQRLALQEVIDEAVQAVAPLVQQFRQWLDRELPEAPVYVLGDPLRLAQVFTNLLSNAVKYTPDGGHIWVGLRQVAHRAEIRIRDDGVGIMAEDVPHLFDIFSRGRSEPPSRHRSEGLGVGLALAQRLVEQHGGALEGHSEGPGQGSEFMVTLPLDAPAPSRIARGASKGDAGPRPAARRILVVDDNPDVADSFRVLLEAMGHQVRTLNRGADVLALIRAFHPEVVFLDIAMPGMDGYQVARGVRAASLDPEPVLVALTGYGQESDREAARQAGFFRHLLKPATPDQVDVVLKELDQRSGLSAVRK